MKLILTLPVERLLVFHEALIEISLARVILLDAS